MGVGAMSGSPDSPRSLGTVDCDVHNAFASRQELQSYLPARWRDYRHADGIFTPPTVGATPKANSAYRLDAFPASGPPGSDLGLLREQLLDRYDIGAAILHPIIDVLGFIQYGEYGLALAQATNEWMAAKWLTADDRLYGGITVPIEDGNLAAEEIARVASHPRFVKVVLTALTREPLGHSKYWPIYAAATDHGLPVSVHVSGFSGVQSGAGWSTYQLEHHANHPLSFISQALSLVCSGVFERFPALQVVFEEGGLAWAPPLLWRLDRAWEAMRSELPQVGERPSETFRRHCWLTTQPIDLPEPPATVADLLRDLAMDDRIMFSTDYPHHDFDDPARVLPAAEVGSARRQRIFSENARSLFRFAAPAERAQHAA